ncbi:MAG: hypothetical protein IT293_02635 [Deltaproteobacteria bacterium]|nr:hypothetical protein [Deltaproteobacteria bacterium]
MPKARGASRALALTTALALALATGAGARAADAKPAVKKAARAKKPAASQPLGPKEAVQAMVEGEDVREFRTFCDTWMRKLQERNTFNSAHITWAKGGAGVTGEYLSYGTERTCIAREEPGKDPIGKITYREIKYRKEGPTESAAMGAAGTIVEQTDVTEIFRYAKGRWQY